MNDPDDRTDYERGYDEGYADGHTNAAIEHFNRGFRRGRRHALHQLEQLAAAPTEAFVCDRCGYGQDDTDAIDWDVMYGHERCRNTSCPNHKERHR